jgi:uncharacterized membrane protein YozB (DUF420 family)
LVIDCNAAAETVLPGYTGEDRTMCAGDITVAATTAYDVARSRLISGYRFIRRKRIAAHKACMLSACVTSLLFFASYITYHAQVGSVKFPGLGWPRTLYFSILFTHTILAATVPVLAILTLRLALKQNFPVHRRIARWNGREWSSLGEGISSGAFLAPVLAVAAGEREVYAGGGPFILR